jgi:hypothetical protein
MWWWWWWWWWWLWWWWCASPASATANATASTKDSATVDTNVDASAWCIHFRGVAVKIRHIKSDS